MSWSIGEIRALVIKAARGAGMDWGMAQEAGFAFEWLEKNGVSTTHIIANYLSYVNDQASCTYENCPLKLGSQISDTGDNTLCDQHEIFAPILLAPYLATNLEDEKIILSWQVGKAQISLKDIASDAPAETVQKPHRVVLEVLDTEFTVMPKKTRVEASAKGAIDQLTILANKTYAPATQASRLAGAGAGLNDND